MSDPRVFEAIKYALGLPSCDDPAELQRLGLKKFHSAEEIKSTARQALQQLEQANVQFSEDERVRAAKQIKLLARELLSATETKNPPSNVAAKPAVPDTKTTANLANPSANETTKPKLVAKPVDPGKLVARVVATAPTPTANPDDTPAEPKDDVQFRPVPAAKRPRGSARPWLGWALLGLLLISCGAAVGALFWLRDKPYFAFQSETTPKDDPKSDLSGPRPNLGSNDNNTSTDSKNPPNTNPQTDPTDPTSNPPTDSQPPVLPPTTDPPTDSQPPVVPPTTDPPTTDLNSGDPSTDVDTSINNATGTEVTPPVRPDETNSVTSEPTAGLRLAVLRQLELSLVAIAAGQTKMAQSCFDRAKKAAGNEPMFQDALALVEQLHAWRAEINATVASRVPLLANREELPVDDTMVSLISATEKSLVVRAAGQRRQYEANDLPWSIACGVLDVTNSNNLAEDNARKLVAKVLRRPENRVEQLSTLPAEVQELLTTGIESTTYSAENLKHLLSYLEARANLERLCPTAAPLPRVPMADWAPWYRETDQRFKSDRELRTAATNLSLSRYELEEMVLAKADPASAESIARAQLMIHHVSVERKDLVAILDNLSRCEQLLVMEADHNIWTDLGRALLESKPSDQDLVILVESIASAIDGGEFGPASIDGLARVGKQLAQRLSDRTLKQNWLKKFQTSG